MELRQEIAHFSRHAFGWSLSMQFMKGIHVALDQNLIKREEFLVSILRQARTFQQLIGHPLVCRYDHNNRAMLCSVQDDGADFTHPLRIRDRGTAKFQKLPFRHVTMIW